MALDNPAEMLRRHDQHKLEAIKKTNMADDPIVSVEGEEEDSCQTHFRYLDAMHTGPFVSHIVQLERLGIIMPPAETLSDEELNTKLWEVIEGLADCQVFLSSTNHLSDRDLYEHLRLESLVEEHPDLPMGADACIHLDILGGCSEEDIENQYRYYADEKDREHWMAQFPDFVMPEHVDPPYDRDRHLPKVQYRRGNEVEDD